MRFTSTSEALKNIPEANNQNDLKLIALDGAREAMKTDGLDSLETRSATIFEWMNEIEADIAPRIMIRFETKVEFKDSGIDPSTLPPFYLCLGQFIETDKGKYSNLSSKLGTDINANKYRPVDIVVIPESYDPGHPFRFYQKLIEKRGDYGLEFGNYAGQYIEVSEEK